MSSAANFTTEQVVVENNALSDVYNAQAAGKTLEQQAKERVEEQNERYRQENCAGMSAEVCSVKMYEQRREELIDILSTGADFGIDLVPIFGDLKSLAEAQSALDYVATIIGVLPGLGDAASKAIKAAEAALNKGDLAEASRLINQASDEIAGSVVNTGGAVNLDEVNRLKYDPHAGKNKLAEGSAASELQNSMGGNLERVDPDISGADFIFTSGPNKGKTVDFMFTTAKGTAKEIEGMNKFFNNNWDKNVAQLHTHLNKADIVPLDFRNLNAENQQRLLSYINTLSPADKAKVVIMR
ncbi:hypothetical protein [Serratia sp. DD3]|uniref:hypothetical protein n=1 Tax=Serratia sp. DD3 TaxID=1410619 RepID=UPI0006912917|nr:hypothetical protein [Serratia sp. DD3]